MAEIHDLNPTDASNTGRFPENMAPSAVNNGARALEGIIARYESDMDYTVTATLSGSVIQMTANRTSLTLTGTTSNYFANAVMAFTNGASENPSPCSVNINGIGAISLRDAAGATLAAGLIPAGSQAMIMKDGTNDYWRLLVPHSNAGNPVLLSRTTLTTTSQLILTPSPAFFRWSLRLRRVAVGTDGSDVDLYLRTSSADISSGYAQSYVSTNETGSTVSGVGDTVTGRININSGTGVGNASGEWLNADIDIDDPGVASANSKIFGVTTKWFNTSGFIHNATGGGYNTTAAALDGLRLAPSSGNFAAGGVVEVWGWR